MKSTWGNEEPECASLDPTEGESQSVMMKTREKCSERGQTESRLSIRCGNFRASQGIVYNANKRGSQ